MNEMQTQLLITLGTYIGIFFGAVISMQVMSKGLLFKYISVKSSRKKKLLMVIRGVTGTYFKIGKLKESKLKWTSNSGDKCSAPLDYNFVSDFGGIPSLTYDEVTNQFIQHTNGEEIHSELDPQKVDIMVQRAYLLGQLQNTKTMLIIIIALVIIAVLSIASVFIGYKSFKTIEFIAQQVSVLNTTVPTMVMP
jgi:hypothetical protein